MRVRTTLLAGTGRLSSRFFLTSSLALALALVAQAGTDRKDDKDEKSGSAPEVEISNFGKVTDNLYRGAQPRDEEYRQLAAIGVKTIVDLRNDPKGDARTLAERAGLRYINMPLSDKDYPAADAAQRFLEIANNSAYWPVYIHCAGGRHRTGIMAAVYRITQEGWDIDRAYGEMKTYDFYTRFGHGVMKKYIFDFYREFREAQERQKTPAGQTLGDTHLQ